MLVPQCGRTSACPRSARSCTPPPPSLCDLHRLYELLPELINKLHSPEFISKFSSPAELDSVIAELLGTLKKAATCSKKTRSPSSSPGIMPWWSPELQTLKSNFRNASEEKRENKTDETVERYRVAKQIYQRELRQAEKKSWEDLCSKELNTDLFTGLKKIATAHSQLPGPPSSIVHDGVTLTEPAEILKAFSAGFFLSDSANSENHSAVVSEVENCLAKNIGANNWLCSRDLSARIGRGVRKLQKNESAGTGWVLAAMA